MVVADISVSGGAKFNVVFKLKEPELKITSPLLVASSLISPPDELISTSPEVDNNASFLFNIKIPPTLSSETEERTLNSPDAPIEIEPVEESIIKNPLEESI